MASKGTYTSLSWRQQVSVTSSLRSHVIGRQLLTSRDVTLLLVVLSSCTTASADLCLHVMYITLYTPSNASLKRELFTLAYLGGARCDAPLWPDHENFLQATLYEKMRFLPFSSKNCKIQQCLIIFCVSKFQKNRRICGFH